MDGGNLLISHSLDAIQCLLVPSMRDGTGDLEDCLLFVKSARTSGHVLFESKADA